MERAAAECRLLPAIVRLLLLDATAAQRCCRFAEQSDSHCCGAVVDFHLKRADSFESLVERRMDSASDCVGIFVQRSTSCRCRVVVVATSGNMTLDDVVVLLRSGSRAGVNARDAASKRHV